MNKAIEKLTIEGKVYIPEESIKQEHVGDIKIVILQRGWVMVGVFERNGSDCKLHRAAIIRKWGTLKGLPEIADNGPTAETVLDKTNGLVEFDYLTTIAIIACNGGKWQNVL